MQLRAEVVAVPGLGEGAVCLLCRGWCTFPLAQSASSRPRYHGTPMLTHQSELQLTTRFPNRNLLVSAHIPVKKPTCPRMPSTRVTQLRAAARLRLHRPDGQRCVSWSFFFYVRVFSDGEPKMQSRCSDATTMSTVATAAPRPLDEGRPRRNFSVLRAWFVTSTL